jgi:hypothetical protein
MEREEIIAALKSLAEGKDPVTGESLDGERPLQEPSVIRTLLHAVLHLEQPAARRSRASINAERNLPSKSFTPWTAEDEARLVERFKAGDSVPTLAAELERTEGSIQARLIRLALIPDPRVGPLPAPRAPE